MNFLRQGAALCLALACLPTAASVSNVVVVFKTHFDIGYTDMASNVVRRYRTTMIDQALAVADQNRDVARERAFAWTLPGWPLKAILDDWPGQTAVRRQRVMEAFRGGRFVVHALPFTTHTELLEVEDVVRGLGYASALCRGVGLPLPRDAKMTDVPSHTWLLPTLLRHAGVDFLHLGCNSASASPEVPALFWWEGPDGSRLLTLYSPTYGSALVPPADWPYPVWLALIHTGDNHGPPTPEEVRQVLEEAAQKLPGVRVTIGRLSDFADLLLARRPELPVVRGDMPDTWIHGPMGDPEGARLARRVRPLMAATETLHTELAAWGVAAPPVAQALAQAREQSLLYGEHTWGGGLYWITTYEEGKVRYPYGEAWRTARARGDFARIESSWEEHSSYIRRAAEVSDAAFAGQLSALASAVAVDGPRLVVFNPLPWAQSGWVEVEAPGFPGSAVHPAGGGAAVPLDRLKSRLRFRAGPVPASGYETYVPVKAEAAALRVRVDESAAVLENPTFTLGLDGSRGCIRSLVERRTGREWVDGGAPTGMGQFVYERFDAEDVRQFTEAYLRERAAWAVNELGKPLLPPATEVPYRRLVPANVALHFERHADAVTAVMESERTQDLAFRVTTRVTLPAAESWLEIEVVVHEKPADPWPEAGWIALPLRAESPRFRIGRPGSIIDPTTEIVAGASRHLLAVNPGLAVLDANGDGLGICPIDSPLVSLDEPGCWKYSRTFVPTRPWVYVNLFNNQWTTNFRLWNSGTWVSRVRLWPVAGRDLATGLIRPATEARMGLAGAFSSGPGGRLFVRRRGLEVDRPGVLVTAFGPNPDGPGTLLRLWEASGQAGGCFVRLPEQMAVTRAQRCDLRGENRGEVEAVRDGRLEVDIRPFAPVSVILD